MGVALFLHLGRGATPSEPGLPAIPTADQAANQTTDKAAEPPSATQEKPHDATPGADGTALAEEGEPPATSPREARVQAARKSFVKRPGAMLTDDGRVLTFPAPKPGEFRIVHSHGKMYRCDSEGNWEDITPRPLFDNSFEENLVGLSVEGGSFIPGMLMGLETNAIMPLLRRDVVINDDDTEDEKAKKAAVAEMKGVILDYIEQGGTFDQFVMEMRSLTVQERALKAKAYKKVGELINEGKLDEARAYRDTFNAVMDEHGFPPLKYPPSVSAMLGD